MSDGGERLGPGLRVGNIVVDQVHPVALGDGHDFFGEVLFAVIHHVIGTQIEADLRPVGGASGDRDRSKRPLMGAALGTADLAVLTSDNPRSEDPDDIIREVAAGVPADAVAHIEPDRRRAIRHARSAADVDVAVAAARRAFESGPWSTTPAVERGRLLMKLSELVAENQDELAALESRDTGKPLRQGVADMVAAARYFEFYGGAADKIHGDTLQFLTGFHAMTVRGHGRIES